jgi:hypothetical protein
LAAGKLAALLARRQARDLFDSYGILHMENLDNNRYVQPLLYTVQ